MEMTDFTALWWKIQHENSNQMRREYIAKMGWFAFLSFMRNDIEDYHFDTTAGYLYFLLNLNFVNNVPMQVIVGHELKTQITFVWAVSDGPNHTPGIFSNIYQVLRLMRDRDVPIGSCNAKSNAIHLEIINDGEKRMLKIGG